jgi:indole-3-pyruvate monooxygenase
MPAQSTNTLIIGASIAGLAAAACLQKRGIDYLIIERHLRVAAPWRNHYQRLHLHTNKRLSNLPYQKFGRRIPRYPTRQQVVDYLEDYQEAFDIRPLFNTEALSVKRVGDNWVTETAGGSFYSRHLIMAAGAYGKPKPVGFSGIDSFPGRVLHSCGYSSGEDYQGQNVLVVGFGNSACEIAIDLYEQGAIPAMAVRSPVNVIPRDVLGIAVLEISLLLRRLPPRLADTISAPLLRALLGDLTKLGLKKKPYGPLEQISREGKAPVLDIGIVRLIRKGYVRVFADIDYIEGSTVHFTDGLQASFDVLVAGIGYDRGADFVQVDPRRFEDLRSSTDRQRYFGEDGLYFCGYWISPTGQIREIARDARKIAKQIKRCTV